MAKNKTTQTAVSVEDFINTLSDNTKRGDSFSIIELMKKLTGMPPKMWGPSIVGFGTYHYTYASGREGDSPLICFSPRATAIVFYLSENLENRTALLEKLGQHTTGKACIYIKKLEDVNMDILQQMIVNHISHHNE